MINPIHLFAAVTGMVSVALAAPHSVTYPVKPTSISAIENIPADYAEMISDDAIAIAWAPDIKSLFATANQEIKWLGVVPFPTTMNDLFDGMMTSDLTIPTDTPVIAWAEFAKGPTGAGPMDVIPFVALKIPGANEKNINAASGTKIFFDGDMVIAAQGDVSNWSKPAKPSTRLVSCLPNKPIAVAVDIAKVWKQQGSQLKMLSNFAVMGLQMSFADSMDTAKSEDRVSIRKTQQLISNFTGSIMNGLMAQMASMDFMTMSLEVARDDFQIQMDFIFNDDLGLDDGVPSKLITDLPGDMTLYGAMSASVARSIFDLELELMDSMMTGLNKNQQSEMDAVAGQTKDLVNSLTGGVAVAVRLDKGLAINKWTELGVKDADAFISSYSTLAQKLSKINMGIEMESTGKDKWSMDINGKTLSKSMSNYFMGNQIPNNFDLDIDLSMVSKGRDVVVAKALTPNASFTDGEGSQQDWLQPPVGRALIGGLVLNFQELLLSVMNSMESPEEAKVIEAVKEMPHPLVIQGSAKDKSFRIDISGFQLGIILPALGKARQVAEERVN